jgi:hypothetical protein
MSSPLDNLKEDVKDTSKRIGETVRTIGLGLIGSIFLIFTSTDLSNYFNIVNTTNRNILFLVLICCLVALILDYLHALVGYLNSESILNQANTALQKMQETPPDGTTSGGKSTSDSNEDVYVKENSVFLALRNIFFYSKQAIIIVGICIFCYFIYNKLWYHEQIRLVSYKEIGTTKIYTCITEDSIFKTLFDKCMVLSEKDKNCNIFLYSNLNDLRVIRSTDSLKSYQNSNYLFLFEKNTTKNNCSFSFKSSCRAHSLSSLVRSLSSSFSIFFLSLNVPSFSNISLGNHMKWIKGVIETATIKPLVPCINQDGKIIRTHRKKKQNRSVCIASKTLKIKINSTLFISFYN